MHRRQSDRPLTVRSVFGGVTLAFGIVLRFVQPHSSEWLTVVLVVLGLGMVYRAYIVDLVRLWRGASPPEPPHE